MVRNNSQSANQVQREESSENYVEDEFESSKEKSLAKGVTNDNITDEIEKQPSKKSVPEVSSSVKSVVEDRSVHEE